jgi:hypothetical protein
LLTLKYPPFLLTRYEAIPREHRLAFAGELSFASFSDESILFNGDKAAQVTADGVKFHRAFDHRMYMSSGRHVVMHALEDINFYPVQVRLN